MRRSERLKRLEWRPIWPGRCRVWWLFCGFGWSWGWRLLIKVIGEEVKGRVGQIGQAVGGGTGAAPRRWARLRGSRDSNDWALPGKQRGQEGRLGRRAEWGQGGLRGGRSRGGGGDGRRWRGVSPVPPFLYCVLFSGGDGDGLEGCLVNYRQRMSGWARNTGMSSKWIRARCGGWGTWDLRNPAVTVFMSWSSHQEWLLASEFSSYF